MSAERRISDRRTRDRRDPHGPTPTHTAPVQPLAAPTPRDLRELLARLHDATVAAQHLRMTGDALTEVLADIQITLHRATEVQTELRRAHKAAVAAATLE